MNVIIPSLRKGFENDENIVVLIFFVDLRASRGTLGPRENHAPQRPGRHMKADELDVTLHTTIRKAVENDENVFSYLSANLGVP